MPAAETGTNARETPQPLPPEETITRHGWRKYGRLMTVVQNGQRPVGVTPVHIPYGSLRLRCPTGSCQPFDTSDPWERMGKTPGNYRKEALIS